MRNILLVLSSSFLLPACVTSIDASPPDTAPDLITCTTHGALEVRSGDPEVSGSSFVCDGTWPSSTNPCATPWSSQATTHADTTASDRVTLTLTRDPIAVDGGSSIVTITLDLDAEGHVVSATAGEVTTRGGDVAQEASAPTGGWVLPVPSRVGDSFQGLFEVDFEWGEISGAYDTTS